MGKEQLLSLARTCGGTLNVVSLGKLIEMAGRENIATFDEVMKAFRLGCTVAALGL